MNVLISYQGESFHNVYIYLITATYTSNIFQFCISILAS